MSSNFGVRRKMVESPMDVRICVVRGSTFDGMNFEKLDSPKLIMIWGRS
jgi:hypothetical protein